MSLSALQVAANSAQPPPDHSRDASAKSGAGAAFAAMISAVAAEAPAASAHGASPKQSGGAEKNGRSSDDSSQTANSQSSQPVETDIAGLVFGALAGQYAQQGATAAAPAQSATPAAASEAPPAAPLWRAVTGRAAVASKDRFSTTTASPASATVAATETSALTAAAAEPSSSSVAALASTAAKSLASTFANAGALDAPQESWPSDPSKSVGNSTLGLSVVQTRTHLGVDDAAQTQAKDPILRAQIASPILAAQSLASGSSGAVGSSSALGSSQARASANRLVAQEQAATSASDGPVTTSTVPTVASAQNGAMSQKRSHRDSSQQSAPAAAAPSTAVSAAAPSGSSGGAATVGAASLGNAQTVLTLGPMAVGKLAAALASQAAGLSPQTATSALSAPGTASVSGAQPVKELEIQLDPADLGAVSVKMRLSDGKLSVVMQVSKPSTLTAVEGERDAIAKRLGVSGQSLESLVIRPFATDPTATNQTATDGGDASGQASEGRNNAQSDARGSAGSQNGGQDSRRQSSAGREDRQTPSYQPVAGRGFGDMRV